MPPHRDGRPGLIELTLLGPGCSFYSWLLSSLGRALEEGVGRRRVGWRIDGVFRVSDAGRRQRLCGGDLRHMPALLSPDRHEVRGATSSPGTRLGVRLLSPTRLVRDGRFLRGAAPVPFEVLVGRILDRWEGLFGDGASEVFGLGSRPGGLRHSSTEPS